MGGNQPAAFALAAALRDLGVRRLFGVPGGGSSLDLIEGARAAALPFTLARHETAGMIMAAASAELTHAPGAMLVTRGPGLANAANGLACAVLERAPVLLVADAVPADERAWVTHQVFDHAALAAPVSKAQARTAGPDAAALARTLAEAAMRAPRGPVLLEMDAAAARAPCAAAPPAPLSGPPAAATAEIGAAVALLARARRPLVIAGLECRAPEATAALRALVAALRCPALVTYKAKGTIPDADPHFAGIFTGGALEAPIVAQADLIILAGADPVEFIPQPWRFPAPVLDIALFSRPAAYTTPAAACVGDPAPALAALAEAARPSAWRPREIAAAAARMRGALATADGPAGLGPQRVVAAAAAACRRLGLDARATVDAGAHMIAATAFWPCTRPNDLLISNGLATMGFALPAAIAAALQEPARPVIAFTGDGGLEMCLGELATATAAGARIVVVVFNDAGLSLIAAKRGGRDLPPGSLAWRHADYAAVMRALGGLGLAARTPPAYAAALRRALRHGGPALIDVRVDPSAYPAQLAALRG